MIWPDSLPAVLHASCVAVGARALLICGRSGSGKSSLALQLMAFGAGLVSDDRTELQLENGAVVAARPGTAGGAFGIEARGVGLLSAERAPPAPLALVVDMGQVEDRRLPPPREVLIAGTAIPLLHKVETGAFPAILWQYLRHGAMEGTT